MNGNRLIGEILAICILLTGGCQATPDRTALQDRKPAPLGYHGWSEITYRPIPATGDRSPAFVSVTPLDAKSFSFSLTYVLRGPRGAGIPVYRSVPRCDEIQVRLHTRDGAIIPITNDGEGTPSSWTTNSPAGENYTYSYIFPWQDRGLDEAWIETRFANQTWWIEIPYGFLGDPNQPVRSASRSSEFPLAASAMKTPRAADRALFWSSVVYRVGELPDKSSLEARLSNSENCRAELVLHEPAEHGDLFSPRMSLHINNLFGRLLDGRLVGINLSDDGLSRTDTFKFSREPTDRRCWATARATIGEQVVEWTIPSSLFGHAQGHAPDLPASLLTNP